MSEFLDLFKNPKPLLAMLHGVKGTDAEVLECMKVEFDIYQRNGVDAVIVENYFCTPEQMEMSLEYVMKNKGDVVVGNNLLDDVKGNFALARKYGTAFMQEDSVCGHLTLEDDAPFEAYIKDEIAKTPAKLLGGVRFKYQPYLSGRPLDVDLKLGMERCHAIAVTGEGTGMETSVSKIQEFRDICGDFPLVVAAGLTMDNLVPSMTIGDACVVGSYLKDGHDAHGRVNEEYVKEFMEGLKRLRG